MLAAIFSRFGLVIYEMVTGTKAFQARSHAGLISAIMSAEPPPLSTVQPMVPPVLEHVVKTCLAKDPQARWQTAHDVLLQLKWISEAGTQVGVPRPVVARRKHRERIAFVTAAVLLVALGALSWIHFTEMRATALWSPDSRYLGFFAGGKILKVDVSGGPPAVLASTSPGMGGTWNHGHAFCLYRRRGDG